MKYQRFASLSAVLLGAAATVSAKHLGGRHEHNQCSKGYTVSVYTSYSTVYLTSTTSATSAAPEITSTSSAVAVVETQAPVETATAVDADAVSTTSSTPVPASVSTSETPVAAPTHTTVAVVAELPTEIAVVAAPSTTSQEATTSTTQAAASTSSSSSSNTPVKSVAASSSGSSSGEATFYGGNVAGGTCSFSGYTLPSGLFGTAFSGAVWDNAAECGACVSVTGPKGNTIKAMIVDQCPECAAGHFDLFQDAFAELSDISAGIIDITWEYTPCELSGPLKLKNKEGTSKYWFSMQVVNANEPVTKLEVSTDGGSTWQSTTRTSYNYFEQSSGFGVDTVDVRVTGQSGATVVVKSVGNTSGSEITASSNL